MKVKSESEVVSDSSDPMDCSLPGSSIHGVFQARVLEWVAIAFSATQETWVQSLDQEDALGKEMAIHSNILAWEIPWTEESGRLQATGSLKSQTRFSN